MNTDRFSEPELLALLPALRRLTAALGLDADTADDVVQETLVRLLAARPRLNRATLASYAMVTARNHAASLRRSEQRHTRHQHRLVEVDTTGSPEDDVLRQEEHAALTAALASLPPRDRALLTAREVDGQPAEAVARRAGVSPATLAVRSARARARLRVEYLLAFRRIQPPTARCRPVLLALSAGDRRRLDDLHAGGHLLGCPSCAAVAEPLLRRSRPLAGLLPGAGLGGLASLVHRAGRRTVSSRPVQVIAATAAAGAVAAVLVLALAGHPASNQPGHTLASHPASTRPGLTLAGHPASTRPSLRPAILTVADRPVTATEASHLSQHIGEPTVAHRAPVLAVPADEGFWIGTGGADRVWVQLVGRGESAKTVKVGDHVTFHGMVVANQPGFATHLGLHSDDGSYLLSQQGAHLAVAYSQLTLASIRRSGS